jgi:hypothetical protein
MKGKAWARFGFGFGVSASLAANVADVLIRPHEPIGGVLSAAYWPLALLVALEVIARVSWPVGRKWWALRYGGLTTVAAIAAILSYRHMVGLLGYYGEDSFSADIGPLAVDGLMVVCSAALLAIADNMRRLPKIGAVE